MDIFVSRRLDNTWTNWSKPENLGPGINSSFDDFSFNYNPLSRYAYFARGFSSQNTDIYKVDLTRLFKHDDAQIAEIGQTRTVADVFEDNVSEINAGAMSELQKILTYLKKYNTIITLVTAHSNRHEDRTESFKLSNERADKIVEFLVKNGIEKERLSFSGLGHDVSANLTGPEDKNETGNSGVASSVEFKVISR
jgi:hypothetical protein